MLKDWEIEALDIKTAFLYGELDEDLMEQPEGFIIKGQAGKVYKLKKALYGLKQASLAWNKQANASLKSLGFRCVGNMSHYNSCDMSDNIVISITKEPLDGSSSYLHNH